MPNCNVDNQYLERLSKMCCDSSSFRNCNKIALVESACLNRIEKLHKMAGSVGMESSHILNIHISARNYYETHFTQSDFLHTYESFLKQAIIQRRWIKQAITISIAETIKMDKESKKRNYYLSRDWIGINKLIKNKK